jgi:hypothetical protein
MAIILSNFIALSHYLFFVYDLSDKNFYEMNSAFIAIKSSHFYLISITDLKWTYLVVNLLSLQTVYFIGVSLVLGIYQIPAIEYVIMFATLYNCSSSIKLKFRIESELGSIY